MNPSIIQHQNLRCDFVNDQELRMHQKSPTKPYASITLAASQSHRLEHLAGHRNGQENNQHYASQKNILEGSHLSMGSDKSQGGRLRLKRQSESTDCQEVREKMMAMMREQIQIAVSFYSEKMKVSLKQQAKEIMVLRQQLDSNEKELAAKNKIIDSLSVKRAETPKKRLSVTTVVNSPSQQSQQSQQKVSSRMTEIEQQLRNVEGFLFDQQEQQNQLKKKIDLIERGLIKVFGLKIAGCHRKIDQYIASREQNLERIYAGIIELEKGPKNGNSDGLETKVNQKMNKICVQIGQLRDQIKTFSQREFKYEDYRVDSLRHQVEDLKKQISKFTDHSYPGSATKVVNVRLDKNQIVRAEHGKLAHTEILSHSNLKGTQYTRNSSNVDMSEVSAKAKKPLLRNHSHAHSEAGQHNLFKTFQQYEDVESCCSEERDVEDQYESSMSENFSEGDEYENQARLIQVLLAAGHSLPVAVEIDQTGYLKCIKEGMYLVDRNDNGFELREEEVKRLVSQRIITLQRP